MHTPARLLWLGALETLPLVVAAFPFGIVFGAMANTLDLTLGITLGMSAIVFAGSSQFIALTLMASAAILPVIVLTVFIVNLRQMLYSANLMHHAIGWPQWQRAVLAFFLTDETFAVDDDHVPFLNAGVPAVDVIDLEYPPWHTADDTLDKVSARSMEVVGRVVTAALPKIERRLLGPSR